MTWLSVLLAWAKDRRLLDARLNKQTGSGRGAIADGAQ